MVLVAALILLFQVYEVPPEAVKTTEPPWQNVVGPLTIALATGGWLTVRVSGADGLDTQPAALVMMTLYVPPAVTEIVCVVAPLFQA